MPRSTLLCTTASRTVIRTLWSKKNLFLDVFGFTHPSNFQVHRNGFNGECAEPMTGHYLPGGARRSYNPALRRWHSADSLSPFARGGINAYAYCGSDPVNWHDPSGQFRVRLIRIGQTGGLVLGLPRLGIVAAGVLRRGGVVRAGLRLPPAAQYAARWVGTGATASASANVQHSSRDLKGSAAGGPMRVPTLSLKGRVDAAGKASGRPRYASILEALSANTMLSPPNAPNKLRKRLTQSVRRLRQGQDAAPGPGSAHHPFS